MDLYTEQPVPFGEWVHVVAVVSREELVRMYINGEQARVGAQPGAEYQRWITRWEGIASDQVPAINGHPFPIDPRETFDGDLDELVIYDRPLPGDVVRELYEPGVMGLATDSAQ